MESPVKWYLIRKLEIKLSTLTLKPGDLDQQDMLLILGTVCKPLFLPIYIFSVFCFESWLPLNPLNAFYLPL